MDHSDAKQQVGRRSFFRKLTAGTVGFLAALSGTAQTTQAGNSPSGQCGLYLPASSNKCAAYPNHPKRWWVVPTSTERWYCVEVYQQTASPSSCFDQVSQIVCSYEFSLPGGGGGGDRLPTI
jgi:hypothetical protein